MIRLVCLLMVTAAWSAGAEEPAGTKLPVVTFAPFPVPGKVAIVQGGPGVTSKDRSFLNSPFASDHPPFVGIDFGDTVSDQNNSANALRVYRIDEVDRAPYPTIRPVIEKLRQRLASRRESDLDRLDVPVYPIPNALELIQVRTQYFDAAWGSGIFFATAFSSGVEEYPDNSSLTYLFEGLSKDGKYFVSAVFKVTHPKLDSSGYDPHLVSASGPTGSPVRQANQKKATAATAKAQAFLAGQPDDAFQPSLGKLWRWVSTLTFREPWQ